MNIILADTHSHMYLPEFDSDREKLIKEAISKGVKYIFLPNIDSSSINKMNELAAVFPDNCYPMIGLHPTSVKDNYEAELEIIRNELSRNKYYGIGETGIDLYWDTSHINKQELAFEEQIRMALKYDLPIIIHARNSFDEIIAILEDYRNPGLRGIFHAFTGNLETAEKVIGMGFSLGIGGILTFKNSGIQDVVKNTDIKHIVLETDSPYLAPVPFRGKRNESSYLIYIAEALSRIKGISIQEVASKTTENVLNIFNK